MPPFFPDRPKEFIECVSHIRLLSWLLLGSLTHNAVCPNASSPCLPIPLDAGSHIADHLIVILIGFPEQSKVSDFCRFRLSALELLMETLISQLVSSEKWRRYSSPSCGCWESDSVLMPCLELFKFPGCPFLPRNCFLAYFYGDKLWSQGRIGFSGIFVTKQYREITGYKYNKNSVLSFLNQGCSGGGGMGCMPHLILCALSFQLRFLRTHELTAWN